ncbi:hypothetical protein GX48_00500 [Paracoccidioides brasiliensis]|nr:hypothetical protein GX48_00500 [Paracoccidioides brasiliensis]
MRAHHMEWGRETRERGRELRIKTAAGANEARRLLPQLYYASNTSIDLVAFHCSPENQAVGNLFEANALHVGHVAEPAQDTAI